MKKLLTLTGIASIGAVLALLAACQTTGTTDVIAQKEALLTQSGFKIITVTTPTQQQAVSQLTAGRVTAVKYNGKIVSTCFRLRRRTRSTYGTPSPIQRL